MKIKTVAAAAVVLTLFQTAVTAENTLTVEPIDLVSNKVTISGHIDTEKESVTVVVANPGTDLENLTSGEDMLQQYREIETDEKGNYSIGFEMSDSAVSGEYGVYLMNTHFSEPMKALFYFAAADDRKNAIDEINENSVDEISKKIGEYTKIFGAGSLNAVDAADDKEIADHLKKYIPYERDGYVAVQEKLMEGAILSCYRNKKTEYVRDEKGNPKNAAVIGFNDLDNDYKCTLYKVFNDILNESGKKAVFENISKDYADFDALKKDFMVNVFLLAIDNTDKMGGGHISDIITKENAAAVGLNAEKYLNYSNKNTLNNKIAEKGKFSSLKELEDAIADIIKNLSNSGSGSGSSSGGSGSGSSGGISGPGASIVPQIKEDVFSDVDKSFWGNDAILYLYENDIVNGFNDGTFRPNDYIKREQAVKMLSAAFKIEEIEYDGMFSDVNKSDWFSGFVAALVNKEAVKGINSDLFGVGKDITREDFAVMLYRMIGDNSTGNGSFADDDEISAYAKDAVAYMNEKGYINGYADGTFRPKKKITRAEAASVIYKYIGR